MYESLPFLLLPYANMHFITCNVVMKFGLAPTLRSWWKRYI